jgi:hypothetical protein
MKRTLLLALAIALVGCGSDMTTVDYVDVPFLPDFGSPEDLSTIDPVDVVADVGMDINYPDFGILEYYEPYGDDNVQCQGFQDPPDNNHKIDHCIFDMSYNQERTFKVMYFEDGKPVPSQEISWELVNVEDPDTGNPIATIDAKSSGTNPDGIASVKVSTYGVGGQFALKAKAVTKMTSVPPLYFDIVIQSKKGAPLTVKFKHDGATIFGLHKAYLFLQDDHGAPACGDLDVNHLPPADKASAELTDITQTAQFTSFADLTPENPLMFTIIGTGYNHNGPVLAFGCDDLEGLVEFNKSTVVTIVMRDVPPQYKGKYEIINHFDMISALPDDIEIIVNTVIDFFNSPTAGLMKLTCILKDQASVLEDLCDNFFNDPDDPQIDDLTMIGGIVQQVIDSILYSLLKDNVGGDILFTGKDVGNMLRDLEIHSTIDIKDEPDSTGFIPKSLTAEEWHTVSIQWTLGEECNPMDPDCGQMSFSFNAIGQDVVISEFDARIGETPQDFMAAQFDKLLIYPHPLNFKYGAFLNFMIEKFILPMVAGDGSDGMPVVDSYEKFFSSLVGGKQCLVLNDCCEVFSEAIAAEAGDWVKGMIKTGCDMLIPLAADYLRKFLLDLDADTGDTFTIATRDGQPCTLYDNDNNQVIDTWGKQDPPELRCMWDVLLKLGGTDVLFDAEFWGKRQQ